jgi:hypothetical protein
VVVFPEHSISVITLSVPSPRAGPGARFRRAPKK